MSVCTHATVSMELVAVCSPRPSARDHSVQARPVTCRLQRINREEIVTLVYNQHVVSNFVANVQQEMHRSKRHVASGLVISQVCQQLGVSEYKELGLGNPQQLPVLRRLSELESRLATYITSYTATRLQPDSANARQHRVITSVTYYTAGRSQPDNAQSCHHW